MQTTGQFTATQFGSSKHKQTAPGTMVTHSNETLIGTGLQMFLETIIGGEHDPYSSSVWQ